MNNISFSLSFEFCLLAGGIFFSLLMIACVSYTPKKVRKERRIYDEEGEIRVIEITDSLSQDFNYQIDCFVNKTEFKNPD